MEAYYYINKAIKYSPFDKAINSKFKQIDKRYQDKLSSFKDEDFIIEVSRVEDNVLIKINIKDGNILEEKLNS